MCVPDAGTGGTRDAAGTGMHRGFGHPWWDARTLSLAGMALGWLFLVSSLTPSLVPRSWLTQGFVSGTALLLGYGLGVAIAWAARLIRVPLPSARVRRQAWYVLAALALATIPLFLVLSSRWEGPIRRAAGISGAGPLLYLGTFVVAAGLAAAAVGVVRLIRGGYRMLAARLRFLPAFVAPLTATILVVALTAALIASLENQFSATNDSNLPGISRPLSPLRSGGPSSLVTWDSLGLQGRAFVARGPAPADIERLTGRHAIEPIRVYAGLESAPTLQGEADLVLRELQRTGAFHRALIAIVTPTGRGSVYSTFANPLEYLYGGNTAIAAIQYSYQPSWIAFLTQRPLAQDAGRALFNTIYDYWSTLPATHRPRLVVAGESLGAYGIEAAFSGVADITARTSGALFIGAPNDTGARRELTGARARGSPEWLPVYGEGRTVCFAASAKNLLQPGGGLRHPKIVYVQHASDPVVWWSPSLIWHKPDWLAEPPGPGVPSKMRWYPLVTFGQLTADLIVNSMAPGSGHRYGAEVTVAWAAILQPPGWTDANIGRLTAGLP